MKTITLVTSNPNKLQEIQAIFPKTMCFRSEALELDEIQTLDRKKLATRKLMQAFEQLKKPVMIEDVSAHLSCLNGLPGPYIKDFEKLLGEDALFILAEKYEDRSCEIICTAGYYDGSNIIIAGGVVDGEIVAPRGNNGWGFDKVFVQDGYSKTNGELSEQEKNTDSHRARAFRSLAIKISDLNSQKDTTR